MIRYHVTGNTSAALLLKLALAVLVFTGRPAKSQTVSVGAGGYSTSLPFGEVGPQNSSGQNVVPLVSSDFALPVQSNDFWSSLVYPFFGDQHSNVLYAHPINAKATSAGLQIGYTSQHTFAAADYLYPFAPQLTVGVDGMSASRTVAKDYGDWTVTAQWEGGASDLEATLGHGLPYVFFRLSGGDAVVTTTAPPIVWSNQDEVLGVTIDGKHYGIFGPTGSTWSTAGSFRSSLGGKDYLAVAVLPEGNAATLELFRQHAYAFVVNSRVDWSYDEVRADVTTTYSYDTVLLDSIASNQNETLTALYRHQWLHTPQTMTGHNYQSPRGMMKLYEGNVFTTRLRFSGVLPALPDRGDYNRADLLALVQDAATETLPVLPTYDSGKAMGRFSHLVHIADQLGAVTERDHFLSEIKKSLEEWFTVGGAQEYSYIDAWDVLTGYPSGFGADNQINDHHFHSSYAVMSAATVARYDSAWAAADNWGGMVNLLIKDANNWDRSDEQFPFLRSHDAYAGHSWAAGHGDFGDGNNQESSSESMNFASAAILWGEATNQPAIRDLGVFLHATETSAVEQYWFDVDDTVFPADYPHVAIGMVWGGKGVHSTWFGALPEFIHGINILPVTSSSLYLGRHPDYVLANYEEIVAERSGQPTIWQDVLWEYLALADANLALSYYYADEDYTPFDGESRAHTLHWLYNLKKMGRVDTTIFADTPTYAVFRDASDEVTYIAHNSAPQERVVNFTDGFSMLVPARTTSSASTAIDNPDAPVALLFADKTTGKAPLTVTFQGSRSFDRNGGELEYAWTFSPGATSASADTTYTFHEVGETTVTLTVTDTQGLVAADSVLIRVLGNGTPFLGAPHEVPGKIEAEHFDLGGEGVAYHDTEANNIGLAFRPNEGVDIEASNDQGFDVYWITAGEWIEYTINVADSGAYDIVPYVASVPGFGNFRILVDNVDVSGKKPVLNTGGWQFWQGIPVEGVSIDAGEHILRFEFDSDTDKTGWLFSLNYIDIAPATRVGVDDDADDDPDRPGEFALVQNYPNPFGRTTTISYALPSPERVRIEVFNTIGQVVRVLVDRTQEAGRYSEVFDASGLPNGAYFYRLTTQSYQRTHKMLIVR